MLLSSPAFGDGEPIPPLHTCDGANVSPELRWTGVPAGAVTLSLTCQDPDAPMGTFTHWVMWNMNRDRGRILAGEVPEEARQGLNDFGHIGYDGPCPPPGHGIHHYRFMLYAVATEIPLAEGATIADLHASLVGVTLTKAELVGTYAR
jgi:Raf kinase inhibitor-like YbhB/YbcL family protein